MYTLKLMVGPDNWRLFSLRKADPAFKRFSAKVMARDDYKCQFCGFRATNFQEVVNLDGNYYNNKLSNLVTSCCFCAQCLFIETVGHDDYGGGVLIYYPKVSQSNLNGLCHVLFCAITNNVNYRLGAQNIYKGLKLRSQIIESHFGEGMSNPVLFGRVFVSISRQEQNEVIKDILPTMRLLPSYTKFVKQVETWSKESLNSLEYL